MSKLEYATIDSASLAEPLKSGFAAAVKCVQFKPALRFIVAVLLVNIVMFGTISNSDAVEVPRPMIFDDNIFDLFLDHSNNVEESEIRSYGTEASFPAIQGHNNRPASLSNWNGGSYRTEYEPREHRKDGTVYRPTFTATNYAVAAYSQYRYNAHVPALGNDAGKNLSNNGNPNNSSHNAWRLCTCRYGTWYANWWKFRFEPNADAIKGLDEGDVVWTSIRMKVFNPDRTWEFTRNEYLIKITRAGVSMAWDGDSSRNPVVIVGAEADEYPDFTGTVKLSFPSGHSFLGGASENLNGTGARGGNRTPIYVEDLPEGFRQAGTTHHQYGWGWSNGGSRLSSGLWFYNETNGKVLFRPRKNEFHHRHGYKNIDDMMPGDEFVSRLTLTVKRGGQTVSSASLTVTIRKPGISIAWNDGVQGTITTGSASDGDVLNGTVTYKHRQSSGWSVAVSGADQTGTANPSPITAANTPQNDPDCAGLHQKLTSGYGNWCWSPNNFKFVLDKNSAAFSALTTGVATTTLTAKLRKSNSDIQTVSITITISATALPQLTIATAEDSNVLTEGSDTAATFTIKSTTAISSSFDIKYTPTSSGSDFLESGKSGNQQTESLTFAPISSVYTATLSLTIEADSKDEFDGRITVVLDAPDDNSYTVGSADTAFYYVKDDIVPLIEIPSISGSVTEGELDSGTNNPKKATFTLITTTAAQHRLNSIDVQYTLTQTGNFLDPVDARQSTVNFDADDSSVKVELSIIDDEVDETNGSVTLTLTPPGTPATGKTSPYVLDSNIANRSRTINLIDNDEPPVVDDTTTPPPTPTPTGTVVTISNNSTPSVTIGGIAYFRVEATPTTPDTNLTVRLNSIQTVNLVTFRIPRIVILRGDEPAFLLVQTVASANLESAGVIKMEVVAYDDSYTVGAESFAEVTIEPVSQQGNPVDPNPEEPSTTTSIAGNVLSSILAQTNITDPDEPPVISVEYGGLGLLEGETGRFKIIANRNVTENTEITLTVATTGDYFNPALPTSTTVVIEDGQSSTTYEITPTDDNVADEPGTVTVTIQPGTGYQVTETEARSRATINITDPTDQFATAGGEAILAANMAFLPELMTTIGSRSMEFTRNRMELAWSGRSGDVLAVNGSATIPGMIESLGYSINDETLSIRSVLGESAFAFNLHPQTGPIESVAVWGLGDLHEVSGNGLDSSSSWNGTTFAGHFGFDLPLNRTMIAGTAVSTTETIVNYAHEPGSITAYNIWTDSMHPYLSFNSPDERTSLGALAGYGVSRVVTDSDVLGHVELTGDFNYALVEGRRNLISFDSLPIPGVAGMDVRGEMRRTRQRIYGRAYISGFETAESQARMAIDGTHQLELDAGTLNTTLSTALRSDSGGRHPATGVEPSVEVGYTSQTGFSITGIGGSFLMDGFNALESGVSTSVSFDAGNDGRGLTANGNAGWGWSKAATNHVLWNRSILDEELGSGLFTEGGLVSGEIGYGLRLQDGFVAAKPYGGFQITTAGTDKVSVGNRLSFGSAIGIELEARRNYKKDARVDDSLQLDTTVNW